MLARKTLILATLFAGTLTLSACKDKNPIESGQFDIKGKTIATVNGVNITQPQLDEYITFSNNMGRPSADPLDEVINMEVLRQKAVEKGLHKTPKVRTAMARAINDVLANALVQEQLKADISDADLKAEYDRQIKEFQETSSPHEFDSSHILLKTEDEAKAVIETLKKGGDFAKLAKEKSTGPSASKGGSLGWASPSNYVAEFAAALKGLEKGKFTETPVKTQFGYHVIKLNNKRDAAQPPIPPFEQVKSQIKKIMVQQNMMKFMQDLRDNAKVDMPKAKEIPAAADKPTNSDAKPEEHKHDENEAEHKHDGDEADHKN